MTWCGTIAAGPMCAQLYGGTSLERRGHPAAVFSPNLQKEILISAIFGTQFFWVPAPTILSSNTSLAPVYWLLLGLPPPPPPAQ